MSKVTPALQAAVVAMLTAKRPALGTLPLLWELRSSGAIYVRHDHSANPDDSIVPQMAFELKRAIRGAHTDSFELPGEGGTIIRAYSVSGHVNGVKIDFHEYHRGIRPDGSPPSTTAERGPGESILDVETAVSELGALPVPIGSDPETPDRLTRTFAPTQALRESDGAE
ncbi:hypothetical protein ACIRQH_20010 [Streptomyces sp. NPDC102279]|uniref:hypothetical protein n=1 Tax=Streptomyces sp. NPDC102279 TaxID=3366153 RepID=UPI0037F109C3